jgi:phage shock protein A
MQSEAAARAEIAKTSVDSRLELLEDQQMDADTEKALAELELKLGLGTAATPTTTSATVTGAQEDDIDRQIRELEQKLQQS